MDEGGAICCELIVARRDPPTLLDPVKELLDQIAGVIKVAVKANWLCAVPLRRDICRRAMLADKCSDPIGVKSTISKQHCSRFQAGQQCADKTVVVRFASRQRETDRHPGIDDRMNLAPQSTSRPTHQLFFVLRNAGAALVHADDGGNDHLHPRVVSDR